ncbi:hypothetical protein [Arthrobacter sp. AQ5-05]|uniref:hypothetical protein n=1 Tax=Arthrobacter sp. AQ5-05 TaxID=2184581 RepID=UPI0012B57F86|nr:hypothetical protein [Arthrobacter sp. AQ5-05]
MLAEAAVPAPQSSATSLRGLPGSTTAACAICGENYPARLLIATHTKPRPESYEEERMDCQTNATLTCALGCEALYEFGYIVVGPTGQIQPGQPAETPRIEDAVEHLAGRHCTAFDECTAEDLPRTSGSCWSPSPIRTTGLKARRYEGTTAAPGRVPPSCASRSGSLPRKTEDLRSLAPA